MVKSEQSPSLTGDRICRKEVSHGEVDAIQCASFRIVRLSGAARLVVCMAAIVMAYSDQVYRCARENRRSPPLARHDFQWRGRASRPG
jgi:predicted DCC family thiol-disulfide oxidoreductase YuxK